MKTTDQKERRLAGNIPTLYDKHEAAAILRVKVSWLERRAADRRVPFTLLGGSYRFTPDHLAAIVELHEKGALAGETRPKPAHRTRRSRRRQESGVPTAPDGFVPLRARPRKAAS